MDVEPRRVHSYIFCVTRLYLAYLLHWGLVVLKLRPSSVNLLYCTSFSDYHHIQLNNVKRGTHSIPKTLQRDVEFHCIHEIAGCYIFWCDTFTMFLLFPLLFQETPSSWFGGWSTLHWIPLLPWLRPLNLTESKEDRSNDWCWLSPFYFLWNNLI